MLGFSLLYWTLAFPLEGGALGLAPYRAQKTQHWVGAGSWKPSGKWKQLQKHIRSCPAVFTPSLTGSTVTWCLPISRPILAAPALHSPSFTLGRVWH